MHQHERMQDMLKDDIVSRSRDLQNQATWYASQHASSKDVFECDEEALRTSCSSAKRENSNHFTLRTDTTLEYKHTQVPQNMQ